MVGTMEHPSNPVRKEMGKVNIIPAKYTPLAKEAWRVPESHQESPWLLEYGASKILRRGNSLDPQQESIFVTSRFPKKSTW